MEHAHLHVYAYCLCLYPHLSTIYAHMPVHMHFHRSDLPYDLAEWKLFTTEPKRGMKADRLIDSKTLDDSGVCTCPFEFVSVYTTYLDTGHAYAEIPTHTCPYTSPYTCPCTYVHMSLSVFIHRCERWCPTPDRDRASWCVRNPPDCRDQQGAAG